MKNITWKVNRKKNKRLFSHIKKWVHLHKHQHFFPVSKNNIYALKCDVQYIYM